MYKHIGGRRGSAKAAPSSYVLWKLTGAARPGYTNGKEDREEEKI